MNLSEPRGILMPGSNHKNFEQEHEFMITESSFFKLIGYATQDSQLSASPIHGDKHWRAVSLQGVWLAKKLQMSQEARLIALLFGLFHDCRRENEDYDPLHGQRGASVLASVEDFVVSPEIMNKVVSACELHHHQKNTDDVYLGLCWDADRSLLGRVGMVPSQAYFSVARNDTFDDFVSNAQQYWHDAPSWHDLYQYYKSDI